MCIVVYRYYVTGRILTFLKWKSNSMNLSLTLMLNDVLFAIIICFNIGSWTAQDRKDFAQVVTADCFWEAFLQI